MGPDKPVRLWVVGDSGTATANARAVRDYYLNFATNQPADLFLMLGDNAYQTGTDPEYQAAVFDTYPTVLRNTVLWPTIGNHETAQATSIATFPYLDIFSLPQNGEAGGLPSGTERYYSFDYANIHFICLDSMTASRATNGAMANWLRADLESTTQEWLVAFWHHPPYTKGSYNSDAETELIEMRQNFLPLLEQHGVDLVLCGHSHSYERSGLLQGHYGLSGTLNAAMKLSAGNGQESSNGAYLKTSGDGTAYVVAGSSGQVTGSGTLNHPAMFVSLYELGSLVIDVSSNRLDVKMLGTTSVRDSFTIRKQPAPAPQFDRYVNQGVKARRAQFLTPDWLVLTNVATISSATGSIARVNDWVCYTPPALLTNSDTFQYTVTDSRGTNLIAAATTVIVSNNAPSQNVLVEDAGNGAVRVRFSGVPGRTYSIQFSNDVNAPSWQTAATATANARGEFEFMDNPPPATTRLYRSATP